MFSSPDSEENRLAACFQNRNFRLLWTSQVFGQSAQIAIFFVLMVMMEELTQSSALVGLMVLIYNLPSILLSLPSGVIVDRFRKKHILLLCNISRIFLVAGFIFFNRYGQGRGLLTAVYILTFVLSTIGQLSDPAESAMVPLLVSPDQLLAANSVFHLLFNVAQVLGLLLLAPLSLKIGGVDGAFATISLSYLLTTGLIWPISVHEAQPERHSAEDIVRQFWEELKEGWRFILSREPVLTAIAQHGLIQVVSMIIAVLAPGFFTRALGMQPTDAIYILFFAGLGMFLTTMWTGRLGHRFRRRTLAAAGLLMVGLALLGLAYVAWRSEIDAATLARPSQQVIMLVVLMGLLLGVGGTLAAVAVQTTVQERAPHGIRGRVIAAEFLFANVVGLIPMLIVSSLADIIGIPTVLLGLSITVLVSALLSFRTWHWPREP
jgi:MFS family permease